MPIDAFQVQFESGGWVIKAGWVLDGEVNVRFRLVIGDPATFDHEVATKLDRVHELNRLDVLVALRELKKQYRGEVPNDFYQIEDELKEKIAASFLT